MVLSLLFLFQAFATYPRNEVDRFCCKRCVSSDTIFIVKDFWVAYETIQKKSIEEVFAEPHFVFAMDNYNYVYHFCRKIWILLHGNRVKQKMLHGNF